jgi:hypothetical protein
MLVFAAQGVAFRLVSRFAGRVRADLPIKYFQRFVSQPQIAQRERLVRLRIVLLQSPVTHLYVPELALEHAKRVLDLGTNAGLQAFELVLELTQRLVLVRRRAFARGVSLRPNARPAWNRRVCQRLGGPRRRTHRSPARTAVHWPRRRR